MAYIGRDTDKLSNIEVLDTITFDGSSSYTLQKNSVNFTPSSANNVLVSIDGVVQANNFTVSGSTIDFGVAVPSTSTCDWIYHIGVGLITTPADGTVTTAKLADSSVSLAKLSATGTKDATTFLRGDNTFSTLPASGITVAQQFRLTTGFSTTSTVPISSNWEQVDTDGYGGIGTAMSESSGVFTFPTTGIYLISISVDAYRGGDTRYWKVRLDTTTNNSTYDIAADSHGGIKLTSSDTHDSVYTEFIFDVTDVSTHKVRFGIEADQSTTILGSTTKNQTCATFIRLGDT